MLHGAPSSSRPGSPAYPLQLDKPADAAPTTATDRPARQWVRHWHCADVLPRCLPLLTRSVLAATAPCASLDPPGLHARASPAYAPSPAPQHTRASALHALLKRATGWLKHHGARAGGQLSGRITVRHPSFGTQPAQPRPLPDVPTPLLQHSGGMHWELRKCVLHESHLRSRCSHAPQQ